MRPQATQLARQPTQPMRRPTHLARRPPRCCVARLACLTLASLALLAVACAPESAETKFCNKLEEVASPGVPVSVSETLQSLQELLPVTPLAVREPVETMIAIFEQFVNTPDPEVAEQNLLARNREMAATAEALEAYAQRHCDYNLDRFLPSVASLPTTSQPINQVS